MQVNKCMGRLHFRGRNTQGLEIKRAYDSIVPMPIASSWWFPSKGRSPWMLLDPWEVPACLIHETERSSCVDCQQAKERHKLSLLLQHGLSFSCTCQSSGWPALFPGRGLRERARDMPSAAQLSGSAQLEAQAHWLSISFEVTSINSLFSPCHVPGPHLHPQPTLALACFPWTKVLFLTLMDILALQPLLHTGLNTIPV